MKKINWTWKMKKVSTVLPRSLNEFNNLSTLFELPIKSNFRYVNGDIYFDEDEVQKTTLIIRKKIIEDINYPQKIAEKIFTIEAEIKHFGQLIKNTNLKLISLKNLKEILKKWASLLQKINGFMSFRGTIQISDVLSELVKAELLYGLRMIGEEEKFEDCFITITNPSRVSFIFEEKYDLISIGELIESEKLEFNNPTIKKLLQSHKEKFGSTKFHWLIGEEMKDNELLFRVDDILKKGASKEKKCISMERELIEKEIGEIVTKAKFSPNSKIYLSHLRLFMFLRTYIKDIIGKLLYEAKDMLTEYAVRQSLTLDELLSLTKNEVFEIEEYTYKEIKKKVEKRKKNIIFEFIEGQCNFYDENFEPSLDNGLPPKIQTVLSGQTACKGIAKGTACILMSAAEIGKIREGDILITSMTTPDFIMAMEKASAFVTDEGGITCHAAIISREMKKPCVVGTLYATKMFKDGDIIEVNANDGIVRKIMQ